MPTCKAVKLSLIASYPDFLMEVMTFGAEHLLHELLKANLIKAGKDGTRPNRAACHPAILHQFRRNVELSLEIPNG